MKTLLLFHESVQIAFSRSAPHSDQVSFSTFDELPAHIDSRLYNAIIFLKRSIDVESVRYIRLIQDNGFNRKIYMLGTPVSDHVYRMIVKDEMRDLAEISMFPEVQLNSLIGRSQNPGEHSPKKDVAEVLFRLEHLPALRINRQGKVVRVNEAFIKHFRFNLFNLEGRPLSKLVPEYTVEQILGHFQQPEAVSLYGNCNFFDSDENIIPIRYTSLLVDGDELILTIDDLSRVVRLKRHADRLNQQLVQEHQLFDRLLADAAGISVELMELLQQVFSADRVYRIAVKKEAPNNRLTTSILYPEQTVNPLPGPFIPYLLDAYRTNELTILHFSVNNKNHADIAHWAQTAVLIPIKKEKSPFVFLFVYNNHFEPDPFAYGLLRYLKSLLSVMDKSAREEQASDFFHDFMENAREGMYKSTMDGRLVYANPALLQMLGYDDLEELRNLNIAENIYADARDRKKLLDRLRQTGYLDFFETVLKRKSGHNIHVQGSARVYREPGGEKDYLVGILRDISATRALKEELKRNMRLTSDIVDNSSILIAGYSGGRWLIWNNRIEQVLGYRLEAFRDFEHLVNSLATDESNIRFYIDRMWEYLSGGSDEPVEMELRSKRGLPLSISWTVYKSEVDGDEILIFFGVDVTQARVLERRIRETENLRLMSTMSNRIADVFYGYFEDMSQELSAFKSRKEISREQLIEIIHQGLLEGSRIAEKVAKLAGASRPVNEILLKPNLAVEHSIQILKTTMPESIKIDFALDAHGQIRLAENQLTQIMLNLALNAASAMREGGTLFIETKVVDALENDFLKHNVPTGQKYFNLAFRDTGQGMDAQTRKKMFEPFFTTSSGKAVKGLGATYIYFIVKAANGFIDVQSEPGKGTLVNIYFPLLSDKAQTKTVKTGHTPTILVVDDQLAVRELMKDIFVADGYNVLQADNGEDGLRLYKENREQIDLVIVDIIMPKMNGAQLYYALHELNPELPILITSGYSDPELKKELIEHGARGYIPKPPDVARLRTQISELLPLEEKIAK